MCLLLSSLWNSRHLFWCAALCLLAAGTAHSHPQDQVRIEVQFDQNDITLKTILFPFVPETGSGFTDEFSGEAIPLMPQFSLYADGDRLNGKDTAIKEDSFTHDTLSFVVETRYRISQQPTRMKLVLNRSDAPECLAIFHFDNDGTDARLLDKTRPLYFNHQGLLKSEGGPIAETSQEPAHSTGLSWALFGDYARHGVWHILTGYDHMLFMAALALAAVSLWDLVGVVTAFTLAHTVTLTLSVLDIFRLDPGIVEPVIAASIVVVAAQNIIAPRSSRGWIRWAMAFGFGLFHGLGFAGGLMETMSGLGGMTVIPAIIAFSIGVEVGHQCVVLPLFGARRTLNHVMANSDEGEQTQLMILRGGSALICLAGIYYFIQAI